MTKDVIKLLIIVNTFLALYWGYNILFKPVHYKYPVYFQNETDETAPWKTITGGMVIWKMKTIEAPVPRFINKYKKRLWGTK